MTLSALLRVPTVTDFVRSLAMTLFFTTSTSSFPYINDLRTVESSPSIRGRFSTTRHRLPFFRAFCFPLSELTTLRLPVFSSRSFLSFLHFSEVGAIYIDTQPLHIARTLSVVVDSGSTLPIGVPKTALWNRRSLSFVPPWNCRRHHWRP